MKSGERVIPSSELDERLRIISGRIDSVMAGVLYDGGTAFKNPTIQQGASSVTPGVELTVTFPFAFSVAPKITYGVQTTDDVNVVFNTPTTGGFKLRAFNRTSGSAVTVHWRAVGKRI